MGESPDDLDRCPVATTGSALSQVPVIDVGPVLVDPAAPAAADAVYAIAAACRDWGFFQVVGHGVPGSLIDSVWRETASFFRQPQPVKDAICRSRENPWGYYNNELTKNQRDKKEVFDFTTDGTDPIYRSANRWPDMPGAFRRTLSDYRDAVTSLSLSLLDAFCVGLGLQRNFLRGYFEPQHTGFVRLNFYPVDDPLAGTTVERLPVADLGVHHHTDAGALTVLLQDDVGGLQVYRDGYWYDVRPVAGAFVINTGDMMQVWSNDIYRAAVHRVLAMDRRDRFSIPFFFNPAAGTGVEPLPSVISGDRPARYRTVDWADFRGRRTDGDYADYGPEVQIAQFRI